MRILLTLSILCCAVTTFASDIREFDIKTIERLGNELTRVSQQSDRGATNPVRKHAQQAAKAALQGKLFNMRYDYVVLDDPDGSGFLVYGLAQGSKSADTVVHGHFRVTVSADGEKAERVDALSHGLDIVTKDSPKVGDYKKWGFATNQTVGTKPVETLVYASNHMKIPIAVATPPKGQVWFIENGKIRKSDSKK